MHQKNRLTFCSETLATRRRLHYKWSKWFFQGSKWDIALLLSILKVPILLHTEPFLKYKFAPLNKTQSKGLSFRSYSWWSKSHTFFSKPFFFICKRAIFGQRFFLNSEMHRGRFHDYFIQSTRTAPLRAARVSNKAKKYKKFKFVEFLLYF